MFSLSQKDRASLCSFTFSDGRRCRSPRFGNHPRFCPGHAEKEARARAAQKLGRDVDYFFSGGYLSANDLATALGRLIPAVIRGDVKPRAARTVAYLAQTLLQTIHIAQNEYTNAFGSDAWRNSVRNSVNGNYDHRFPPDPQRSGGLQAGPVPPSFVVAGLQTDQAPQPASPQPVSLVNCHSDRSEEPASCPSAPPSPHAPLPPTSAAFVDRVVADLKIGRDQSPQPASPQPGSLVNCHPERSEEPASSVPSPAPTPAVHPSTGHPIPASHPERSEGSPLNHAPLAPNKPAPTPAPQFKQEPFRRFFRHRYRPRTDGQPF